MKISDRKKILFIAGTIVVIVFVLLKNSILYWVDGTLCKEISALSTTGALLYYMLMVAVEFVVAGQTIFKDCSNSGPINKCAIMYMLAVLLMLSYNLDIFTRNINMFGGFQADSESLVAASITAEKLDLQEKYNLGQYRNILNNGNVELRGAAYYDYAFTPYSDSEISNGYSLVTPGIIAVGKGDLAREVFLEGRTVMFADGTVCTVQFKEEKENCIWVYTDCNELLTEDKNGRLIDITVFNESGNSVSLHEYTRYYSQFGLQGMILRKAAKILPMSEMYAIYYILFTLLLAICIVAITTMIAKNYNRLMAFCFYITFLTAPTIINYARNLYWAVFTWFIPMAIGLMCTTYFENRKIRFISCIVAFFAILVKCLCGYEYISAILVSMMMFMFADFTVKCINREKAAAADYFKTMVVMGFAGLAGFAVAILIHAASLDAGSIADNLKYIWEFVVIKRTSGINQPFSAISGIEVIKTYMNFDMDIVTGIYGVHFKKMIVIPIVVFIADLVFCKKIDWKNITLYVLGFAAAASWYLIAKEHSVLHFYMNLVLWYFGFVQMCIYIPLSFIAKLLHLNKTT